MKCAYHQQWVYNLVVIKEAKRWAKHDFIQPDQLKKIQEAYSTPLYHPNLIIRILLLVATLLALLGVTGLIVLFFADAGTRAIAFVCILYGIGSFVALEKLFIARNHYKSGVTEALIYHSCGFTIGGIAAFSEMENTSLILIASLMVCGFAAIRYLDLITMLVAVFSLAGFIFYQCFETGGIVEQLIPFFFMIVFTIIWFLVKRYRKKDELNCWHYNFLTLEAISLLLIYASGNYLVVRELSVQLMDLDIPEGTDIPFAFIFYFFTVAIPVVYLWVGIKNKDRVLLWVSLVALACSVFTFKYYYSLGHTEITLTLAGAILITLAILLTNYLKKVRNGFTRENLMSSNWANLNVEGFLISQTMGGNQTEKTNIIETGGGGDSGGGGASSSF
jgi:hypothetical protein